MPVASRPLGGGKSQVLVEGQGAANVFAEVLKLQVAAAFRLDAVVATLETCAALIFVVLRGDGLAAGEVDQIAAIAPLRLITMHPKST